MRFIWDFLISKSDCPNSWPLDCCPNLTLSLRRSLIGQNRLFGRSGLSSAECSTTALPQQSMLGRCSGLWAQEGGARLASAKHQWTASETRRSDSEQCWTAGCSNPKCYCGKKMKVPLRKQGYKLMGKQRMSGFKVSFYQYVCSNYGFWVALPHFK